MFSSLISAGADPTELGLGGLAQVLKEQNSFEDKLKKKNLDKWIDG